VRDLLTGLPPLTERVQQIREGGGRAATNAADNYRQLQQSQEEYVKGVSSWNFDLAALKAQAATEADAEGSAPQTPTYAPGMPTSEAGRAAGGVGRPRSWGVRGCARLGRPGSKAVLKTRYSAGSPWPV
jgi:serine/threonine-protein kinase OSR1/STK39